MARKIKAREPHRLLASGLSQNAIARATHMSRHSIREVLGAPLVRARQGDLCQDNQACYIRQPNLEDPWRESRDKPGSERKLLWKYEAFGLLMSDEWLLERPNELFRGILLELFELRYGRASTVLCAQFRKKDWHPKLGGGVHADAIMDRIVHNAAWLEMGDMNVRQATAGKGR